ncbi:hypothetical protein QUB61_09985 [Microcoleus sp. C2D2]
MSNQAAACSGTAKAIFSFTAISLCDRPHFKRTYLAEATCRDSHIHRKVFITGDRPQKSQLAVKNYD